MMNKPWVAVIIGSKNDKDKIEKSQLREVLLSCGVNWAESVFSAHRHNLELKKYCEKALNEGVKLFIVGAGKAAHLPGTVAAVTNYTIPVLAVAISSTAYPNALDAELSISRMPAGCPVAFMGIDGDGFLNAAMVACQIIGSGGDIVSKMLLKKLVAYRESNMDPPEEHYHFHGEE